MDQSQVREFEARCTQEAMPQCRARCPLRMDVRAFMERMAEGDMREARKVLERHLPLPEIMARICDHPCEARCLRRDLGGSLAIGSLEAMCIASVGRQGKSFPRPPKGASIAVLGNGLAGMVAAFELSRKAWPVTVFHEGQAHEALVRRFSRLSEELVRDEIAALEKIGCKFREVTLGPEIFAEARNGFTALFVDADAAAEIFSGLEALPDPATCLVRDNICAGGMPEQSPTGARHISSSKQAGEGRRAAVTLERYVSGVSLTAERNGELEGESSLYTPLDAVKVQEAVLPEGDVYTPEEAAREAARCIRCQCLACVKECVYLQKYGGYPRSYARQIWNNATIVKGEHRANSLINGCMLCGQCAEICPERFSMAELCLLARRDMVKRGYMPQSAHEFALEDMDSANGAKSSLFMGDPSGKKNIYAFFPGCQLAASRGEQVLAAYEFLREIAPEGAGVALFLHCCGVPAHWAGNEGRFKHNLARIRAEWEELGKPELIVACASCLKTFREAAPDIPLVSLWETLDRHYAGFSALPAEKTLVIHDPCSARNDAGWLKSVRSLAAGFGVELKEPARAGKETSCCGYGGLLWSAQPELADAVAGRRAGDLGGPALASCIMCRDRLVSGGQECWHILDFLPFSKNCISVPERAGKMPGPGLSARRANRAALRQRALRRFCGADIVETSWRVKIDPDLLAVLERKHILRSDVEEAVTAVEARKSRFLERQSGHYVGAWRPRKVTFWVRYSVEGKDSYLLHDAWCHRMIVPGASNGA